MTRIGLTLAVVLVAIAACGCASQKKVTFGTPVAPAVEEMKVGKVLGQAAALEGKTVRVRGVVQAMCPGSGCWVELADERGETSDARKLFVWFTYDKSLGRLPMEGVGSEAVVEGKLLMREVSQDERRHFAEEKGMPAAEIERKIVGSVKEPRVEADFVELSGAPASAKTSPGTCGGA